MIKEFIIALDDKENSFSTFDVVAVREHFENFCLSEKAGAWAVLCVDITPEDTALMVKTEIENTNPNDPTYPASIKKYSISESKFIKRKDVFIDGVFDHVETTFLYRTNFIFSQAELDLWNSNNINDVDAVLETTRNRILLSNVLELK